MIELKGKYNKATVFTDNIEQTAISQIIDLCNQKAYEESKIRIMPDVHAGAGCTIGTTMSIHDKICPNLVGVDIGCGLTSVKLFDELPEPISEKDFFEGLDNIINNHIPVGMNTHSHNVRDAILYMDALKTSIKNYKELEQNINIERALKSLGTLGGGNHFIEVGVDNTGAWWLTVHSGSRNIGKQIAEFYQKKAIEICKEDVPKSLKYLSKYDGYFEDYLKAVDIMQKYASRNRVKIIKDIISEINPDFIDDFDTLNRIDTIHNYIDFSNNIPILRKGAVSAKEDELLLIPMNMRDGIIICKGKGNEDWNNSAPHGAGRLYSRGKAKEAFTLDEYQESMKDVYSTCVTLSTIDENPMVYKPMKEIMDNIIDTVILIDLIKPKYNFKA